jgi:HEAT repeat protein
MSRPSLFACLFFATMSGLLAAQPPKEKDPPKEPTHAGKSLSEWIKQLADGDPGDKVKAARSLRELGQHSDAVIEKLIATAQDTTGIDPAFRAELIGTVLADFGPPAVPALTQGLWSDSLLIRGMCLQALRRMGADGRSAGPSIARLLTEPNALARKYAIEALWAVEARSAIPALTKLLDDRDPDVRWLVARALADLGADSSTLVPVLIQQKELGTLGRLGAEAAPAVPALVAQLKEADAVLATRIADALGQIGPAAKDAVPALKKTLADAKDKTVELQSPIAIAMWRIARDPDAAKLLRANLGKKFVSQFLEATLWRIDSGPDTVAALETMLKSENPSDAITAAGVLGTKSKDAVPLLAKMAAHKEPRIRAEAVVALVRLASQGKEALEALRTAAKDDDPQIAFWATVAVCRLDPKPETVAAVAGYLSDRNPMLRRDTADILRWLGDAGKPALARLTATLDDPEETVRIVVATALWKIDRNPAALPAVAKLCRSTDPQIREQAVTEIGVTFGADGKAAVPDLVKRLFDPFANVRSATAEALGRIGPNAKDAAPALLALLEGDEPRFVQSAACEALGLIEPTDKDAVAALLKKKLEHTDPLTRTHAALALFIVSGDKAGEKVAERGLTYRTHNVRITAAEALWRMNKDERAVPLLVRALEESNLEGPGSENERYMAVRALGRMGAAAKPAVPELRKLLTHHDPMLSIAAAAALAAIDPTAKK